MYPDIPIDDISWPITQHAGVINRTVVEKLLGACVAFNGRPLDPAVINQQIIASGILTQNVRSDSNQVDAWRDYQQILSELGLIFSTRITRELILTPIAIEFLDGGITYEELTTVQLLKYQYPNGHKTQLSPRLKYGYAQSVGATTFTEVQASLGILVRPAVLIFSVLEKLLRSGEIPVLTIDELQTYLVRCLTNADDELCASMLIDARRNKHHALTPLPHARRNMQDWIKLLSQTPIFESANFKQISLSGFALNHIDELKMVCSRLSDPESFWIYNREPNFKFNWYSFYGNIDLNFSYTPSTAHSDADFKTQESLEAPHEGPYDSNLPNPSLINLRDYTTSTPDFSVKGRQQVISNYDYALSRKGYFLHDSMVSFIARRCASKGAEVFEDRSSVDLFIRYRGREFLIEVKSITPHNFIHRLRVAIGQIKQYDYLLPKKAERRLGLAFTAHIPDQSWTIPFVTSHLNMDLLTMTDDNLFVRTNNPYSRALFNE